MELIYVAGPYRSKCEWQLEGFLRHAEDASLKLWKEGWAVICPHKNTAHFGGALGIPDSVWLDGDLEIISRCDAIYMLKGFEDSKGATAELERALDLGLDVYYEDSVEEFIEV